MIQILWEFRVREGEQDRFEKHYSSSGGWATLFHRSPAFRGTTLLRDQDNPWRYITADVWDDMQSFQDFRSRFDADYRALDRECEEFTEEERCLGAFDIF